MFGREIELGLAGDVNVGVLYISAVTSVAIYGITIAGWASNNKYALMGGLRSAAQMISYELALGLTLVGPILMAGSMSVNDIVVDQRGLWNVVSQPIGFAIWVIAPAIPIGLLVFAALRLRR